MAGERTLYRKIQVVLEYAKEGKHMDQDSLIRIVLSRQPTNFSYYWRDKKTDQIKEGYSESSLLKTIQTCVDLKLLTTSGVALTKRGVTATDPDRFPHVVGRSVCEYLTAKGIQIASIEKAIKANLHKAPPSPPTVKEIWLQLNEPEDDLDPQEFGQMMTLLGQCEVLLMTQKRIFLPYS